MPKKRLFLLGGHDLEMEEIRRLLKKNGCKAYERDAESDCLYADGNLGWGAKLSDYRDLLDFDGEIYGIELTEDIEPPQNYRAIDHHGRLWCRPSALEQVAELLDVELNRLQRLVAANDRGHIAALKAMSATPEEIVKIREADMQAQGVTEEEKVQACHQAQSIEKQEHFYYIETTLKHTSPLVDLLIQANKTPLIVVNKEQKSLTYYGEGVLKLADKFQKDIDEKRAYYGGNPPAYFGLTAEYFADHTIKESIEAITKALKHDTMHSYHIFMLPFVTRGATPKPGKKWQEIPYAIKGEDAVYRYNEYTYFHDFVRPVLFNEKPGEGISRYFEYSDQKGEYIIEVKGQTYCLDLDGVALRHFKNGVGILSFHLINRRYDDFNDILRINDFGRHLYPQFLGEALVENTIDSLLACSLTLALEGQKPMQERFDHYRDIEKIADRPHRFPRFVEKLLGDIYGNSDFTPIIDDRMYVICHLMHDSKAQELTAYEEQTDTYAYETSDEWYRFVFVDNDWTNVQNPKMKRELIAKSTYARWSDYGTLYGITRYSFMLLTQKSDFALTALNRHIRTVYFQMVTLQLAYRAMALIFTKKVTELLQKGQEHIDIEESTKLYYDYLDFINRIYFREVTPQEQGIELYEMMKSLMRTERDFKELDAEISELHNYIDIRSEKSRNDRLETISKLGAVFLPPTLLAGMLGMNMIDFDTSPAMAAGSVLTIFASGGIGYLIANPKKLKVMGHFVIDFKKLKKVLGAFLIFFLFTPVFWYIYNSSNHSQTQQPQSIPKDAHVTKK